jgi:uncharacterized protein YkwD
MATPKSTISLVCRRLSICGLLSAAAFLVAGALAPTVSSRALPGNDSPGRFDSPEAQMLNLTNQDRTAPQNLEETQGRAQPLRWDDRLAAVARAHSEDMARAGYLSHEGSDGSMPAQRVSYMGIRWLSTGENVARARDAAEAESLFMDEPRFQQNHRSNILNPNYTIVGIGAARDSEGALYITEEFAQTR